MNRFPILAVALTLSLAAAPSPEPLQAATSIQKCRSADGSIGYTDGSCRVFGNESVAISSHLLDDPTAGFGEDSTAIGTDALRSTAFAPGRRSPAAGCARTPTQLAMDLQASLAMGDVNRVAESYHWAGMTNDAGQETMDRLQGLVGRPVVDSRYLDASYGFADAGMFASAGAGQDMGGSAGMLQVLLASGDGNGATSVDFDVHHFRGCYFVSF